jgi:undecaprenyl-diphosphatase
MSDPVSGGTAAALGLVQGLTEFLPVSSSGHVALGAFLFGEAHLPLPMVIALHAGTLIATVAVLRLDVAALLRSTLQIMREPRRVTTTEDGKEWLGLLLATVLTAAIGLSLEPHVESWSHSRSAVGLGLLVTAVALLATRRASGERATLSLWAYGLVGLAQGIAVIPGISRSGSTIAIAMLLGMSSARAFRFSFLLSLPAIAGAVVLKLSDVAVLRELGTAGLVGGTVALASGALCLVVLRKLVSQGHLWVFAIYLIPLAAALLAGLL